MARGRLNIEVYHKICVDLIWPVMKRINGNPEADFDSNLIFYKIWMEILSMTSHLWVWSPLSRFDILTAVSCSFLLICLRLPYLSFSNCTSREIQCSALANLINCIVFRKWPWFWANLLAIFHPHKSCHILHVIHFYARSSNWAMICQFFLPPLPKFH